MAKNLKLNIKNTQIAQAVNLGALKSKIGKKKAEASSDESTKLASEQSVASAQESTSSEKKEETPKVKARSKSAFADGHIPTIEHPSQEHTNGHGNGYGSHHEEQESVREDYSQEESISPRVFEEERSALSDKEEIFTKEKSASHHLSPESLRAKLFKESSDNETLEGSAHTETSHQEAKETFLKKEQKFTPSADIPVAPPEAPRKTPSLLLRKTSYTPPLENLPPREKLGPTGRHVKDLAPPPRPPARPQSERAPYSGGQHQGQRPYPPRGDGQRGDGARGEGHRGEGRPPQGSRPEGFRRDAPYGTPQRPQTGYGNPPAYGGNRPPRAPGQYPSSPSSHQGGYQGGGYQGDRNRAQTAPGGGTSPDLKPRSRDGIAPIGAPNDEKKEVKTPSKFKEFRDIKPTKKASDTRQFDARDRHGLRAGDDEDSWRGKKRKGGTKFQAEELTIRPTSLKVRLPITIKDLAEKMKLKSSQLVGKLFLQGVVVTLNDELDDETTVQLLGHDFGCEITIDTSEQERVRITDKTVKEEILADFGKETLITRPPVVAFMGHVDHGKTSLIDAIRSSNRAAGEAGAITQHIGAFRCSTPVGDLTVLDTPGHEAFSAMRARGADVTDIVVLVVAGDEGLRQQTLEAIQHAKAAKVTIIVAINKCDKPNFNAETVYRQLSEHELLPEAWGGQTITINCSAVTKEGIKELLEMLAIQAEVLELKANPSVRARGSVIESEMHKGMGAVATLLVQNGTLKVGDALVFSEHFGKVKTMRDEFGRLLKEAPPSTPVSITGLSGLPEAGEEFIVVKSEKEAKEISEIRTQGIKQTNQLLKKKFSMDNLLQNASEAGKKILNVILRADMQGSLEALKVALMKIESQKAELNIIFTGIGEVSESDVQLAAASKAVILGFHTQIESHAENLVKELGIEVRLHDIIYHAIDDIKLLMAGLLDKIAVETEKGKAFIKAVFKSSQLGNICGCQVTEGTIARNNLVRVLRGKEVVWKGGISSLKRVKEDVREVTKGIECGILLNNFQDPKEGDIIEAYEITYLTQEL